MRALFLFAFLAPIGCNDKDTAADSVAAVDCSTRDFTVASPRGETRVAWDAGNERMIFFGGNQAPAIDCSPQYDYVGDLWAFHTDCGNFEQLSVSDGPGPRGRYAIATDGSRQRALLHGGRYREGSSGSYDLSDELWAFDYETDTWSLLASGGPDARYNHTIAVAGDRLVLFGGNTSSSGAVYTPNQDTWIFDFTTGEWSELSASGPPEPRLYHSSAASADTLYVYGGVDESLFSPTADFFDGVWALDIGAASWTKLHGTDGAPDGRFGAGMVLDEARNRLLVWAGHDDSTLGATNQLWEYAIGSDEWNELSLGDVYNSGSAGFCDFPAEFVTPDFDAPERRYAGGTALAGEEMIIFGGKTDCGMLNDVWSWNLAEGGWTEHSPSTSGEICLRAYSECESMCF